MATEKCVATYQLSLDANIVSDVPVALWKKLKTTANGAESVESARKDASPPTTYAHHRCQSKCGKRPCGAALTTAPKEGAEAILVAKLTLKIFGPKKLLVFLVLGCGCLLVVRVKGYLPHGIGPKKCRDIFERNSQCILKVSSSHYKYFSVPMSTTHFSVPVH